MRAMTSRPLQFLLLVLVGWANRRQVEIIDNLKEENRILAGAGPQSPAAVYR